MIRTRQTRPVVARPAVPGWLALALLIAAATPAAAQQSWEYSPYKLRTWVALEPSPRLTPTVLNRIADVVQRRSKVIGKSTWTMDVKPAPVGAASDILYYNDALTDQHMIEADDSEKDSTITVCDKLYVVAVRDLRFRFDVVVRELDMHTRIWGRPLHTEVHQATLIPDVVMNLIARAFKPVMRIESIDEKDVIARNRAMGLIQESIALATLQDGGGGNNESQKIDTLGTAIGGSFTLSFRNEGPTEPIAYNATAADVQTALQGLDSIEEDDVLVTGMAGGPWVVEFTGKYQNANTDELTANGSKLKKATSICKVPEGAVLQAVVRRNDRLGQPLKGGILVPPWTICQVLGYDGINAKMRLHAGKSNPLGVRKGVRTQRYAILIRPEEQPTRLFLKSDVVGDPEPLVGYDFYEKDPTDLEIPAKHLGKSDWRGSFVVATNGRPFRLIYVRSGGKLMARMPVVPGHHVEAIAFMRDDDRRLEAEAYIRSVESEIMDQVVQRKLLERNILKRLEAQKITDAEAMVERFQELPKQVDMKDRLDTREGEIADGGVDRRTVRLIGRMFDRAEGLISEHISPTTLFALQRKIQEAQGGAPSPKTPSGAPATNNGAAKKPPADE